MNTFEWFLKQLKHPPLLMVPRNARLFKSVCDRVANKLAGTHERTLNVLFELIGIIQHIPTRVVVPTRAAPELAMSTR